MMDKKQIISLWTGIAITVLMCLFPPYSNGTYNFIWNPPELLNMEYLLLLKEGTLSKYYSINIGQLMVEIGIVALFTAGLIISINKNPRKDDK